MYNIQANIQTQFLTNLVKENGIKRINETIIKENMQKLLVLLVFLFTLLIVMFVSQIETFNMNLDLAALMSISLLISIIQIQIVFNAILNINSNLKNKITNHLIFSQLIVVMIQLINIQYFIINQRHLTLSIKNLTIYFLITIILSENTLSIFIRIINQILTFFIITIQMYFDPEKPLQTQLAIQSCCFLKLIQSCIDHQVMLKKCKELCDQNEFSQKTIHDIRNQIQTSLGTSNEFEDFDQEFEQDDTTTENISEKQTILFKINYLYNIQLNQFNSQIIKNSYIPVIQLTKYMNKSLGYLFKNKNLNLSVAVKSYITNINLDTKIFLYLIQELSQFFHILKVDPLHIQIKYLKNQISEDIIIWIKSDNNSTYYLDELQSQQIISKLIFALNKSVKQEQHSDLNTIRLKISLLTLDVKVNTPVLNCVSIQPRIYIKDLEKHFNSDERRKCTSTQDDSVDMNDQSQDDNDESRYETILYSENFNINQRRKTEQLIPESTESKELEKIVQQNIIQSSQNEVPEFEGPINKSIKTDSNNYKHQNYNEMTNDSNNMKIMESISSKSNDSKLKDAQTHAKANSSILWINTDDEDNILKMNTRVFNKLDLLLICTHDLQELVAVIQDIQNLEIKQFSAPLLRINILMDHNLDGETGLKLIKSLRSINKFLKLNIKFILLSSTEDRITIKEQELIGIEVFISKPLTIKKMIDYINDHVKDNYNVDHQYSNSGSGMQIKVNTINNTYN